MVYLNAGLWPSVYGTAILMICLFAAARFGGLLLGRLGLCLRPGETILFSVAAGLMAISLGVLLIGLCGLLTRTSAALFIFSLLVISFCFSKPNICRVSIWRPVFNRENFGFVL